MNIDTALKIAWVEFLRLGEITYTASELKKKSTFMEIYATRSDILFTEGDQYAMLRHKCFKTDVVHSGIEILLAAIGKSICLVAAI